MSNDKDQQRGGGYHHGRSSSFDALIIPGQGGDDDVDQQPSEYGTNTNHGSGELDVLSPSSSVTTTANRATEQTPPGIVMAETATTADVSTTTTALTNTPPKIVDRGGIGNDDHERTLLTIEHKVGPARASHPRSLISTITASKTIMALGGLAVMTTGSFAGFLRFGRIPNLESQIEALELQTKRMQDEVNRLEEQNDRLEVLNHNLNTSIIEFANLNIQYNESNMVYDGLNKELNTTINVLEEHVAILQDENERYKSLNDIYNEMNQILRTEVHQLTNVTNSLAVQNQLLNETRIALSYENTILHENNHVLNDTIIQFQDIEYSLRYENNRLQELNSDLTSITRFLNETTIDVERTYESMTSYVAELIYRNEYLLVEDLHILYEQRLTNWDCNFVDAFRTKEFANDWNLPLRDNYDAVLTYLDNELFNEVCLSSSDFELFLVNNVMLYDDERSSPRLPAVNVTMNEMISGVQLYVDLAYDYYFPDDPNKLDAASVNNNGTIIIGLDVEDWTKARYRCENLPQQQRFSLSDK